jgi:hypothetical protein
MNRNNFSLANFIIATTWVATTLHCPANAKQVQDDRPRELAGISFSESFRFQDDRELDLDAKIIPRMLYRLRKSSPSTLKRFLDYSKTKTWNDVFESTIDHRFWLFEFDASLRKIEKIDIDAPNTPDAIKYFYRCQCLATDASGQPRRCIVLARTLPRALRDQTAVDEPIRFSGLLYCRTAQDVKDEGPSDQPLAVFITDRLSWFPKQTKVASDSEVALARRGIDVGQLDRVRASNGRPLGRSDREAFYQLLTSSDKQSPRDEQPASIALKSIISKSSEHIGARVTVLAHCRECTRVEIQDPDIQQRYGVDHYFQLILFPNFEQKIVLTEKQNGESTKVTVDRYPVTVCCARLPDSLNPEDVRKSLVSIDGTFFRIWKFQSELNRRSNVTGTISPLIIADQPLLKEPPFWLNDLVTWVLWLGAAMIISLYFYYRFFAGRSGPKTESILATLPEKIDISGLD